MEEMFPEITVETSKAPKNQNLVIGNIENAQVILSAHYDTCAKMLIPNFITPLNHVFSILYGLLICVPFFVVSFIISNLIRYYTDNAVIAISVCWLILYAFIALMIIGPANRHNVNDNTSGVITLCELYSKLSDDTKAKVAIVFFDNEEKGLLGSGVFRKKHKNLLADKLLINLDCVSDGDTILLAVNKKARKRYADALHQVFRSTDEKDILIRNAEKTYYPSDQAGFPLSVAVAAMKRKRIIGYYMDRIHTKNDTVMDERNIRYLCEHLQEFLETI